MDARGLPSYEQLEEQRDAMKQALSNLLPVASTWLAKNAPAQLETIRALVES